MKIFEIAIYNIEEKHSKYPNKFFYTNFKAEDYNQAYEYGVMMAFKNGENTKKMLTVREYREFEQMFLF